MTISELRREYSLGSLSRADLNPDPLGQFDHWLRQAMAAKSGGGWWRRVSIGFYKWVLLVGGQKPIDATAMTLATVDKGGRPSARTVLLKGMDARGLIFFTHHESPKGRDLAGNPQAALVFYWPELERQVCVGGVVSQLPREEADAYFKTRPKGSKLAVWVSHQSAVVSNRKWLEEKFSEVTARYPAQQVPRPPYWGGYVLAPTRIEFWQGRANRLHDRFQYTKQPDGSWLIERLAP